MLYQNAARPHRVPLTPQDIELLEAHPQFEGVDSVFHGRCEKPLSEMSLPATMRRLRLSAVPHGFRSTFTDWVAECSSYPSEVRERPWSICSRKTPSLPASTSLPRFGRVRPARRATGSVVGPAARGKGTRDGSGRSARKQGLLKAAHLKKAWLGATGCQGVAFECARHRGNRSPRRPMLLWAWCRPARRGMPNLRFRLLPRWTRL